jgi:hypothetical protein
MATMTLAVINFFCDSDTIDCLESYLAFVIVTLSTSCLESYLALFPLDSDDKVIGLDEEEAVKILISSTNHASHTPPM